MIRRGANFLLVWLLAGVLLWCLPASAPAQPRPMSEDIYTPLNLAHQYMRNGKIDAARVQLEWVIQVDRYNPYALNGLAVISAYRGGYKEALAYLMDAETHASEYLETCDEICEIGGLCRTLKPSKTQGGQSTIAGVIHYNINLLQNKIAHQKAQEKINPDKNHF
jgi:hypothetical protein